MRLNKFIAQCGICSRRKADQLIKEGKVIINGKKITNFGHQIDPEKDKVFVNKKPITNSSLEKIYIKFHKPINVISTLSDPKERPSIKDFFPKINQRIYPVGRLDWDTEGLLLLTNDGNFSAKITDSKNKVTKTYLAKINGIPTNEQLNKLLKGVSIPGGKVNALSIKKIPGKSNQYTWIRIVIDEGKNKQIHHMFKKINFDVLKLRRTSIGRLKLGTLKKGAYKFLNKKDLIKIFEPDWQVKYSEGTKHKDNFKSKHQYDKK